MDLGKISPGTWFVIGPLAMLVTLSIIVKVYEFVSDLEPVREWRWRRAVKAEARRAARERAHQELVEQIRLEASRAAPKYGRSVSTETKVVLYIVGALATVLLFPFGIAIGLGCAALANRGNQSR